MQVTNYLLLSPIVLDSRVKKHVKIIHPPSVIVIHPMSMHQGSSIFVIRQNFSSSANGIEDE